MRHIIYLVFFTWATAATASTPCERYFNDFKEVYKSQSNWSLLDIKDLVDDDQVIWRTRHPGKCPGAAFVDFRGNGAKKSLAMALISRDGPVATYEKVVVATWNGSQFLIHTLVPPTNIKNTVVISPFVLWRMPAGTYLDLVTGKKLKIENEGLVYEKLEASATLFYLSNDKYKSILLSE